VLQLQTDYVSPTRKISWTNVHYLSDAGRSLDFGAITNVNPLRVDRCKLRLAGGGFGCWSRSRRFPDVVGCRRSVPNFSGVTNAHLLLALLLLLTLLLLLLAAALLCTVQPVCSR
jgi:hypothetical protein